MMDAKEDTIASILSQKSIPFFYKCRNADLILTSSKDLGDDLKMRDVYNLANLCLENPLTLCAQRIISRCFDLMVNHCDHKEHHFILGPTKNFRLIDLVKTACDRVVNVRREDQGMSDRFMICLCNLIWKAILPCPKALENFLRIGGVFTILDVIEKIPNPYRKPWLGMLVDFCYDNAGRSDFAISAHVQVLAWRGKNARKGIFELLAKLYRDEENSEGKLSADHLNLKRCDIKDKEMKTVTSYVEPLIERCKMSPGDITQIVECGEIDVLPFTNLPFKNCIRAKVHAMLRVLDSCDDKVHEDIVNRYGVDGGKSSLDIHDKITLLSAKNFELSFKKQLMNIPDGTELSPHGLNMMQTLEMRRHEEKVLIKDSFLKTANRLSLLKEKQKQIDCLMESRPVQIPGEDFAQDAPETFHLTVDTNIAVTVLYVKNWLKRAECLNQ
ncbi:uncharacterized protein LOC113367663 [Ctenocephalides felis]|uniref:uncharacterized protein LOC113367663 n=1 Tax=Ctenocephalides felis TaxID=7515 RepID=UPI000E6E1F22|nr:uncharacterized protein LOC113367663 [Ctenocephalides felis]